MFAAVYSAAGASDSEAVSSVFASPEVSSAAGAAPASGSLEFSIVSGASVAGADSASFAASSFASASAASFASAAASATVV
ncbi:MAG: hypothetical protein EGP94_12140 [Lachnospiraceae bacterium]|nr:hypothetical protein [Lachnospiraceae bacterium]